MRNLITILLCAVLASTIAGQSRSYTLINSSFIVKASHTKSWYFKNPNCVTVSGAFRAEGGNSNDIKVIIIKDYDIDNWINGHSVTTYYNSGLKTTGRFSVNLNEIENYAIVFSNDAGLVQRAVTANVTVSPCR
jgi:hypothetical protein